MFNSVKSALLILVNAPLGLIGGLVSATLLTLVLRPTLDLVIERKNEMNDGNRLPELPSILNDNFGPPGTTYT